MSGTSGDGVDASIITTDGAEQYSEIVNKYFKYDQKTYENIHNLRCKILKSEDLKKKSKVISVLIVQLKAFMLEVCFK